MYVYINVYTSMPLLKKLEFENIPEGNVFTGIKIEDDLLNHEIRCKIENVEETETIIQEILEEYRLNNLLDKYKITIKS